jgi:hypothetical protein
MFAQEPEKIEHPLPFGLERFEAEPLSILCSIALLIRKPRNTFREALYSAAIVLAGVRCG